MPVLDDPDRAWVPVHALLRRLGAERHRSRAEAVDWLLRVPLAGELTDLGESWRRLVAERCVFWLGSTESWWSAAPEVIAEEVATARREAAAAGAAPEQLALDL